MHFIINNSSMTPIYEQIVEQLTAQIVTGEIKPDAALPSVRVLSNELKISALTVKKAYDHMEQSGYVRTIHGKGTYVLPTNPDLLRETQQKEVEDTLYLAITKAKGSGMTKEEVTQIFALMMEEEYD